MSNRVRLTARGRSSADQTPYPGNVNQPDRKDPDWDQYHTFEQKTNHELPDMRHDWQNDARDDIGFGVPEEWGKSPTVASVRVAATKAVRVAVLLLGDKVSDDVIEAQARDLMSVGQKALDRTLSRFADTQKLYAEDEKVDEKVDEKADEKKAADEKVDEKKDEKVEDEKKASEAEFKPKVEIPGSDEQPKVADEKCTCTAAADAKKIEDEKKDEEKKASDFKAMIAATVAEALKAALPDFIQKKVEEKDEKKDDKKDEKKASDVVPAVVPAVASATVKAADEKKDEKDEKKDEVKAADESDEKDDEKADEKKASAEPKRAMGEFDIELSAAMEDEPAPDAEADERLASLFDNDGLAAAATAGTSDRKVEASQKKAGITKLGGQPRVASAGAEGVDISSIWQSAPDVSEAFK